MSVKSMSLFFAVLALACWAGTFAIVVVSLVRRFGRDDPLEQVREDVGRIALPLAWLVAGVTMLGSLYYSKVQGYIPCELCWYQRICIYPWTVILAIAAWRRDTAIRIYAIPVLCISVVISIYHTWIMAYPPSSGTSFCTLAAPCTTRYVWEFGFVSLPFMALSAAVFMIALLSIAQPPFAADEIVEEVEVSA
jgi:disulfide bond formation protein DsbB